MTWFLAGIVLGVLAAGLIFAAAVMVWDESWQWDDEEEL